MTGRIGPALLSLAMFAAGCRGHDDVSGWPSVRRDVIGRQVVVLRPVEWPGCGARPSAVWPVGTRLVVTSAFREWTVLDTDYNRALARPVGSRDPAFNAFSWRNQPGGVRLIVDPTRFLILPRPAVKWLDVSRPMPDGRAASCELLDAIVAGDARDDDVAMAAVHEMTRRATDAGDADHAWAIDRLARLAGEWNGDLQHRYSDVAVATLATLAPADLRPALPTLRRSAASPFPPRGLRELVARAASNSP